VDRGEGENAFTHIPRWGDSSVGLRTLHVGKLSWPHTHYNYTIVEPVVWGVPMLSKDKILGVGY
jgi:hypothetical protein